MPSQTGQHALPRPRRTVESMAALDDRHTVVFERVAEVGAFEAEPRRRTRGRWPAEFFVLLAENLLDLYRGAGDETESGSRGVLEPRSRSEQRTCRDEKEPEGNPSTGRGVQRSIHAILQFRRMATGPNLPRDCPRCVDAHVWLEGIRRRHHISSSGARISRRR